MVVVSDGVGGAVQVLTRHVIAPIALLDSARATWTDFCCPGDEGVACGFFFLSDALIRPVLMSIYVSENGGRYIPVFVLPARFFLVPPHKVYYAVALLALLAFEARVTGVVNLSRLAAFGDAPAPVGDFVVDGLGVEFGVAK